MLAAWPYLNGHWGSLVVMLLGRDTWAYIAILVPLVVPEGIKAEPPSPPLKLWLWEVQGL